MRVISTVAEIHAVRRELPGSVGVVPTMGYLHAGHIALVTQARAENDSVIATIFVNPTQFGPSEDLAAYPRDLPRDLAMLEAAGTDFVFTPTPAEMYPPGFITWVEPADLPTRLEGARRPGHFRGVATVVTKLFNCTRPTRAYFGQKDAQQAIIIRRMARDLNFDLEVVVCPTVREANGLAMSSRNVYLTPEERDRASVIYRALTAAAAAYEAPIGAPTGVGERRASRLRQIMLDVLAAEPLAQTDYVSVADLETLQEIEGEITRGALLSMAVRFGKARLIDNAPTGAPIGVILSP